MFQQMIRQVYNADTYSLTGKIENIVGMSIEASGGKAAVGDICRIYNGESGGQVIAEVVGFKDDKILLMPYSDMAGISAGNFVRNTGTQLTLRVGEFLRTDYQRTGPAHRRRSCISSGWHSSLHWCQLYQSAGTSSHS